MIALDTNILVYAHRKDVAWHAPAAAAVAALACSAMLWAIPWPCIHEFLAVVTNARAFQYPSAMATALRQVEHWRESPSLQLLGEAPGYWERLKQLALAGHLAGPIIHDAHVAAICLEYGVSELWTADRDFSRMAGLKVRNPLLAAG